MNQAIYGKDGNDSTQDERAISIHIIVKIIYTYNNKLIIGYSP